MVIYTKRLTTLLAKDTDILVCEKAVLSFFFQTCWIRWVLLLQSGDYYLHISRLFPGTRIPSLGVVFLLTSLPRYGRATFEKETDLPISGYRLGLYRLPFLSFPRVTLDSVPRGTFISSSTKHSKLLRQKDTAFGWLGIPCPPRDHTRFLPLEEKRTGETKQ